MLASLETASTDTIANTRDIQTKLQVISRDLSVLSNINRQVNNLPNTIETALASRLTHHESQLERYSTELQLGVLQHRYEMQQLVSLQIIWWNCRDLAYIN